MHTLGAADPDFGVFPDSINYELQPTPAALAVARGWAPSEAAAITWYDRYRSGALVDGVWAKEWGILNNPDLAGLWDAFATAQAMRATNGMTAQLPDMTGPQVLALLQNDLGFGGIPVPAANAQRYRAAFALAMGLWWPVIALERQRFAEYETTADIWAQGTTMFNGGRIPTALLLDMGELPDGMIYAIENGPPWDPTNRTAYFAGGPNYNPAEGAWFMWHFGSGRVDPAEVPAWYQGNFDVSPLLLSVLRGQGPSAWPVTQTAVVSTLPDNGGGPVYSGGSNNGGVEVVPDNGTDPIIIDATGTAPRKWLPWAGVAALVGLALVYDAHHGQHRP